MHIKRVDITKSFNDPAFNNILCKLERIGISYFSQAIISASGSCQTIFSHQNWASNYSRNNLSDFDPCVSYLFNTNKSMVPWNQMGRDWRKVDVMEERNKTCHLVDGLSIYSRNGGSQMITALGSDSRNQIDSLLTKPPVYELGTLLNDIYLYHCNFIEKTR